VASHDRYLVERVTDTVYGMFGDAHLTHLPGGIDEYLSRLSPPSPPSPISPDDHGVTDRNAGVSGPERHDRPSAADSRAAKKELGRLERQLGRLDQREALLHEQLAEHATDYEKVATLDSQLREVQDEKAQTEEAWLVLADQMSGD
jgi:hypothetical protein